MDQEEWETILADSEISNRLNTIVCGWSTRRTLFPCIKTARPRAYIDRNFSHHFVSDADKCLYKILYYM